MATLKEILLQTDFEKVWEQLSRLGPAMEPYRDAYENIFNGLRSADPAENTARMTIRFVEAEPEWTFYFDGEEEETAGSELSVCGFVPGDEEGYAIGLKPPEVLVGLDVAEDTAAAYTPEEIAAHCLAEMTYTATMASSAFGSEKDTAGGGLLASQNCMSEDIQNVDLEALRQELGALPKPDEDYKKKYGFLF